MTVAEYLAFERAAKDKHIYVAGEVFAIAGTSLRHNGIVSNLIALLVEALRGKPCRAFPSDLKVWVPALESFTYPDVVIVCGQPLIYEGETSVITNPRVLIEVLSDSTEAYDRGDKAEGYRTIASVTDYLLISQHKAHVEQFTRQADGSWLFCETGPGGTARITSIEAVVAIDDVYRDVWDLPI